MASEERNFQSLTQSTDERPKSSERGAAYAIHICRRFFIILGVWPSIDAGAYSWRIILTNVSVLVCYCLFAIRSLPTLFYIIFDSPSTAARIRDLGRISFVLIEGIKYFLLRSHRRDVELCVKQIEDDWLEIESPSYKKIMLKHARYGHLVTRICYTATFSAATWYAILPFVVKRSHSNAVHANITMPIKPTRSFAIPSHFGVSFVKKTPIYEIIYSSQVIATFILHTVGVACCSLAAVIVVHACGQLKILMTKLNELVDGRGEGATHSNSLDSVDKRMANIIQHHVKILKFVSSAEKMLRGVCLVSVGGYSLLLCAVGYSLYHEARSDPRNPVAIISYISLYTTFVFNVFSFCYIGELLTQECTKIGKVTYMIEWYRLSRKQALDLGFMMTMAHSPVTLTAGGAVQLSIRCFANVMKTSIGYLNMLRTVID